MDERWPLETPRSRCCHPASVFLSSVYDEGNVGGESLSVIKFPGELENAGTFLAHSFVF